MANFPFIFNNILAAHAYNVEYLSHFIRYSELNLLSIRISEPSWSWSYVCWIYNYLCNQCLVSPLKLWVRIPLMARCIRYNIMW